MALDVLDPSADQDGKGGPLGREVSRGRDRDRRLVLAGPFHFRGVFGESISTSGLPPTFAPTCRKTDRRSP
jgi:hypothetical protein